MVWNYVWDSTNTSPIKWLLQYKLVNLHELACCTQSKRRDPISRWFIETGLFENEYQSCIISTNAAETAKDPLNQTETSVHVKSTTAGAPVQLITLVDFTLIAKYHHSPETNLGFGRSRTGHCIQHQRCAPRPFIYGNPLTHIQHEHTIWYDTRCYLTCTRKMT